MTEYDPGPVLNEYIDRVPTALTAAHNDPLFKAHMEWLDRVLRLAVPAMHREGLDQPATDRVVNTIVYGAPNPDKAIERMADFQTRLQQMQDTVIGKFNPGQQFTGLLEPLVADPIRVVGDLLTSADPEPPTGTLVYDNFGDRWGSVGDYWVPLDAEGGDWDPESWTKIAGNYGPATVVKWGGR